MNMYGRLLFRFCFILSLSLISSYHVCAQQWLTNFAEAKEKAEEEKKPILLVFSGSDWSPPCIRLDREVWPSDYFKAFTDSLFVLVKIDFPKQKKHELDTDQQKHNVKLAEEYNQKGYFPLLLVLNSDGRILDYIDYHKAYVPSTLWSSLSSFVNKP